MSEMALEKSARHAPLAAPVASVLVMEDRAQVTRRLQLRLSAGRRLLAVGPLTPLCADSTLRCRLQPAKGSPTARVLDARVRREYVTRPGRPEEEKSITAAIEKALDEYWEVSDRAVALQTEWQAAGQAAEDLGRQIGQRVGLGIFSSGWREEAQAAWKTRQRCAEEMLALWFEQEERQQRIRRLEEERWAVLQPVSEYRAWLEIDAQAEQDFSGELELEYQVPCAIWRPEYTAELVEGKLRWQSAGVVWQATGEDWRGVELRFSTARPALGAELPLLVEDRLQMRPKSEQEKKVVEVSSRDQIIARTESAPERVSDTPPGLDDGGEARTFTVPGRVDVPSDGRPHRLDYESWEALVEVEYACCPERAPFVFLRSLQTNPSTLPLLAGPVKLVRQGGYVGRAAIGFVAPGERFALSFGSDDELTVLRRLDRRFEETAIRKQRLHAFAVQVYVQNSSLQPRRIKIFERLPVSEISQVEVELDKKTTTPGFKQDDQGLLVWEVQFGPGEEKRLELHFTVKMPHQVHWDG